MLLVAEGASGSFAPKCRRSAKRSSFLETAVCSRCGGAAEVVKDCGSGRACLAVAGEVSNRGAGRPHTDKLAVAVIRS